MHSDSCTLYRCIAPAAAVAVACSLYPRVSFLVLSCASDVRLQSLAESTSQLTAVYLRAILSTIRSNRQRLLASMKQVRTLPACR